MIFFALIIFTSQSIKSITDADGMYGKKKNFNAFNNIYVYIYNIF